jgi:aspartate aminotransferase
MPSIRCHSPEGAFYVFPNVSALYGPLYKDKAISNSTEFSGFLLDAARMAVVPGVEFGSDQHIRISYATSLEKIQQGMDRMAAALAELR